jgi:two-component system CheB/CheR fusion protein
MEKKSDYIIAIGSSAGGLEPLKHFFDSAPMDQVSYVLLPHLSMQYKSELSQILRRHSALKFIEAEDGMHIEPNRVYTLPSGKMMVIEEGNLYLMTRARVPLYPNWAINVFLESLALERKDKSIAVILSGAGSDGTRGIVAIKRAGGMVIAQSPASCSHDSMPTSAINSGEVDFIALPEDMPEIIQHYVTEKMEME